MDKLFITEAAITALTWYETWLRDGIFDSVFIRGAIHGWVLLDVITIDESYILLANLESRTALGEVK